MATTYAEATADDTDVAAFIVAHPDTVNWRSLPVKYWVARDDSGIVAVLMLKILSYPSLDLIVTRPETRPFMRIFKLLCVAEAWLQLHRVPLICISVLNSRAHFQSLIRRVGYEKVGEETDANGNVVETIFGKRLYSATLAAASDTIH